MNFSSAFRRRGKEEKIDIKCLSNTSHVNLPAFYSRRTASDAFKHLKKPFDFILLWLSTPTDFEQIKWTEIKSFSLLICATNIRNKEWRRSKWNEFPTRRNHIENIFRLIFDSLYILNNIFEMKIQWWTQSRLNISRNDLWAQKCQTKVDWIDLWKS